jgi:hypothetical protein
MRIQWDEQNSDMAGTEAAMIRAAKKARRIAIMHGQPIAVMQDGKVVLIPAHELAAEEVAEALAESVKAKTASL